MTRRVLTHVSTSASPHLSKARIRRLVNDIADAAEGSVGWRLGLSIHGFVVVGEQRFLLALDYWLNGYEAWIGLPEEIKFVPHHQEAHDGQNKVH